MVSNLWNGKIMTLLSIDRLIKTGVVCTMLVNKYNDSIFYVTISNILLIQSILKIL